MNPRLTRQELIRRATFGAALISIPGFAAACGGDGGGGGSAGKKELATTLRFSNWTFYIDIDEKTKKRPTLDEFKQKLGVNVVYTEDINSNSEYFGKIQGPLSRGQSIDRDLVVLTDNERFLSVMIDRDWAEKLDKDAIPNISNLLDVQKSPGFDPDREFSLPWQSGMTGIAYDAKATKPITSLDQLLEDPGLKGRMTMLDNFSDSLGIVMLANGDTRARSPTNPSTAPSSASRLRPTPGTSAASPATTTPGRWRTAISRPVSPGPATSSSCRRTTRI